MNCAHTPPHASLSHHPSPAPPRPFYRCSLRSVSPPDFYVRSSQSPSPPYLYTLRLCARTPPPSPLVHMLAGSQGVGVGVTGVEATRLPVRLPPHHNSTPRFALPPHPTPSPPYLYARRLARPACFIRFAKPIAPDLYARRLARPPSLDTLRSTLPAGVTGM